MSLKLNEKGLIFLDDVTINAIFDCVYSMEGGLQSNTKQLLKEPKFKNFVQVLRGLQGFNYQYRFDQVADLFLVFESTVGPMERNSEGTAQWLALGLAIKELYGFRISTFKEIIRLINIRK